MDTSERILYSRRDFGTMVLAGLPLSLAMAARGNSTFHGVLIGAQTYSFRTIPDAEDIIKAMQQIGIGCTCEQHRQQRIFPRARGIDLIDVAGRTGRLGKEIGSKDRAINVRRRLDRFVEAHVPHQAVSKNTPVTALRARSFASIALGYDRPLTL